MAFSTGTRFCGYTFGGDRCPQQQSPGPCAGFPAEPAGRGPAGRCWAGGGAAAAVAVAGAGGLNGGAAEGDEDDEEAEAGRAGHRGTGECRGRQGRAGQSRPAPSGAARAVWRAASSCGSCAVPEPGRSGVAAGCPRTVAGWRRSGRAPEGPRWVPPSASPPQALGAASLRLFNLSATGFPIHEGFFYTSTLLKTQMSRTLECL